MDQLTRIASALERIAVALEKQNEVVNDKYPDATGIYGPCTLDPKDWQWTGPTAEDDKKSEAYHSMFEGDISFGKGKYYDRDLTKDEAHALNRAVKRSTIKVHDGKLEKD